MSRKDFELDMDDKQMKSLLKKAKRKHLLRNWIISMCASIVVIIGIYISSIYFSQKTFIKMEIQRNVLHSVKGPNILFNGHTKLSMGLTGGTIIYSSYKNIAGQPVKWIDEIYEYSSIWGYSQLNFNGNTILDEESGNKKDEFETLPDYNSQTMQREMQFYLPFVTYRNYVNDLKNIGELQNKVGEIAISFDKAYTVEQIEKMLPKDVQPVWYWVDTYNENSPDTYVGLKNPKTGAVLNAEMSTHVYGFQGSYTKKEEYSKENLKRNSKDFMDAMKKLNANDQLNNDDIKNHYKNIKDISPKDLPIYGVVITGTTKSLQQLHDAPYMKAAVRGVIVDKQ